jgi:hypothetical protein
VRDLARKVLSRNGARCKWQISLLQACSPPASPTNAAPTNTIRPSHLMLPSARTLRS